MAVRGKKQATGRAKKPWEGSVGHEPFVVWYGERPDKNYRVYLRWRVATADAARQTNWKWRSLKLSVRDAAGVLMPDAVAKVHAEANEHFRILSGATSERKAEPERLSLADTWPILSAAETGSMPHDTPYRKELDRALKFMRKTLGDGFCWVDLDYERLQKLVRAKADEVAMMPRREVEDGSQVRAYTGYRAGEIVGTRALTMAALLRSKHGRLPAHAPLPSGRGWRDDLKSYVSHKLGGSLPDPHRPRYTIEEVRSLLKVAPDVDPRLDLVLQLGAEYRSGQVVRAMRSDLDVNAGEFVVRGRGKKRGTTVVLTAGQIAAARRALAGYLSQLEAARIEGKIADYPLFPAGRMRKGAAFIDRHATAVPMHSRTMNKHLQDAEDAAEIKHVPGRAFYGMRRQLLDAASDEGISDEGMQEHGAWSSTRTPREIYRDKVHKKARVEASTIRAKIRGEATTDEPSAPPSPPTASTESA